ncbi:MAG TPA: iron-sulfur cluster assembly scaffold protein [Vicinamibacterales bacterium]|nr:iron-sulfur cluster assembly scaffold protein [Vicinamibacterales bacterium]
MPYPPRVLDHFEHPRRAGSFPDGDPAVGTGFVKASGHGDVIRLQVRVDGDRIVDARFKAYGCGWTIACASLTADLLAERSLDDARTLDRRTLARELALPDDKMHCAALAEEAVAAALTDVDRRRTAPSPTRKTTP